MGTTGRSSRLLYIAHESGVDTFLGDFILSMKEKNQKSFGKSKYMQFKNLPDRCLEAFFEYMEEQAHKNPKENHYLYFSSADLYCKECQSQIEQIFYFAYTVLCQYSTKRLNLYLLPQYKIKCGTKHYIADFLFDANEASSPWFEIVNDFKLVIECDGHDFHEKTKEQVIHDNQRDYDLKTNGYDILHFSGSEIYKNPFGCAKKVIEYIESNVKVRQ